MCSRIGATLAGLVAVACSVAPTVRADLVGEYETFFIDSRFAVELRPDGTFATRDALGITQLSGHWSCVGDTLRLEREQWLGAGRPWRAATAADAELLPIEWRVCSEAGQPCLAPARELVRGGDPIESAWKWCRPQPPRLVARAALCGRWALAVIDTCYAMELHADGTWDPPRTVVDGGVGMPDTGRTGRWSFEPATGLLRLDGCATWGGDYAVLRDGERLRLVEWTQREVVPLWASFLPEQRRSLASFLWHRC